MLKNARNKSSYPHFAFLSSGPNVVIPKAPAGQPGQWVQVGAGETHRLTQLWERLTERQGKFLGQHSRR